MNSMVLERFTSCGECADNLQAKGLSGNYRSKKVSETFSAGCLDSSSGQDSGCSPRVGGYTLVGAEKSQHFPFNVAMNIKWI